MSTDRDVTRIVRSWMDEGVTELPDRVLDVVLNQVPATPQRRASWLARRTPTLNTYARLGLVAAAVLAVVIVGIGLFGRSPDVGPATSPTPSASSSPAPSPASSPSVSPDPIVGTWLAPPATCAQQTAAVAAAFTPEQMALAWSCTDVNPVQYSISFGARRTGDGFRNLLQYADGASGWYGSYRIVDDSIFQAGTGSPSGDFIGYYITYHYAIDGDKLTIDMLSDDCPFCSAAELLVEQMTQTAIYETSAFRRQSAPPGA
jgi:hypothetical protein